MDGDHARGGWRRRLRVRLQLMRQRRPWCSAITATIAFGALLWLCVAAVGLATGGRGGASVWAKATAYRFAVRIDGIVHRLALEGVPTMRGQGAVLEEHSVEGHDEARTLALEAPLRMAPLKGTAPRAADALATTGCLNSTATAAAAAAAAAIPTDAPPDWQWLEEMSPSVYAAPAAHGGGSVHELLLPLGEDAESLSAMAGHAAAGADGDGFDAASGALTWTLTPRQACDVELLFSGAFTPLSGFMGVDAYTGVVSNMRIPGSSASQVPPTGALHPHDAALASAAADACACAAALTTWADGEDDESKDSLPACAAWHGEAASATAYYSDACARLTALSPSANERSPSSSSKRRRNDSDVGLVWPIPIVLDLPEAVGARLRHGVSIHLRDPFFNFVGSVTVTDIWRPDKAVEAAAVYGTTEKAHPGVAALFRDSGPVYIGGPVRGVRLPLHLDNVHLRRTPLQLRAELARRGWSRAVGFQTRNPMHRAHIELTRLAAAEARGGLVLHPVVGAPVCAALVVRSQRPPSKWHGFPQSTHTVPRIPCNDRCNKAGRRRSCPARPVLPGAGTRSRRWH